MHSNDNRAVLPLLMLFSCIYSQLRLNHSFCQQLAVNAYHQLKLFIPFGFAALGFALVYLYKQNFDFVSIVQIKKFRLFERFFYTCIFQHHYHQHLLTSLWLNRASSALIHKILVCRIDDVSFAIDWNETVVNYFFSFRMMYHSITLLFWN